MKIRTHTHSLAVDRQTPELPRQLHAAASQGRTEVIPQLLSRGHTADEATPIGFTPLHAATLRNQHQVARVLLEHGARPNQQNLLGVCPSSTPP